MRAKDDVQKLELTHWDQMVHDGTKKFVYSEMLSKNVVVFICVYISVQFHFKVTVRNLISLMKLLFNQLIIGMHEKRNIYIYIIVSLVSCVANSPHVRAIVQIDHAYCFFLFRDSRLVYGDFVSGNAVAEFIHHMVAEQSSLSKL